jgi:hypothetical protein
MGEYSGMSLEGRRELRVYTGGAKIGPSGISSSISVNTLDRSSAAAPAFSCMWPPSRLPAIAAVTPGWYRTQAIAT